MQPFLFRGRTVQIPPTADIPPLYLPNGKLHWVTRAALKQIEPWDKEEAPIDTITLQNTRIREIVVPSDGHRVMWGIHAHHKARHRHPSPFVRVSAPMTDVFTIELVGTPRHPRLVRGYPGEYIPPLPWMVSAGDADGGREYCTEFWQSHAYVLFKGQMRQPNEHVPPSWYHSRPRVSR